MADAADPPFFRVGPQPLVSPVVLSVPHAGRAYRDELLRESRLPLAMLEQLEDRLVDRLVWRATAAGAAAFIARAPRAEIDLNRDEREIDPALIAPPLPARALIQSARSRGGLGLIPSRIVGAGSIWQNRIRREELMRRIEQIHRPYHAALEAELFAARDRFGIAILLDCHSMPPRAPGSAATANEADASVVFGDRHGTTMAPGLLEAAAAAARALGYNVARNNPYAGGFIASRHGHPERGIHALQVEIDRSVYLDAGLRAPGPGFDAAANLIAAIAEALAHDVLAPPQAIAAE